MGCNQKRSASLKSSSNGARQSYTPNTLRTTSGNGVRPKGSTVFGQPKIKLNFGGGGRGR